MTRLAMTIQDLCLVATLALGCLACAPHRPSGHEMMQASLEKQRAERAQEREAIQRNQEEHARKKAEWKAYADGKREQQRQWLEAHPDCARFGATTLGSGCATASESGGAEQCVTMKWASRVDWRQMKKQHAECAEVPVVYWMNEWERGKR